MVSKKAPAGTFSTSFVLPVSLAQHAIWPRFAILPISIYTLPGLFALRLDFHRCYWLALVFYPEREQPSYS